MFTVHLRQTSTRCVMDTGLDPQGYPFSFCWLICQFVKCLLGPCAHAFKALCVCSLCGYLFQIPFFAAPLSGTTDLLGVRSAGIKIPFPPLLPSATYLPGIYLPQTFLFLTFFFFLFLYLVLCVVLQVFDNRSANCAALQKISRDGCVR